MAATPLVEAIPGVAWVKAGNLHLTLKFLGDVEEQRIEAIATSLTKAAAQVDAFDLTIGGFGAFPTRARPRVIWVEANGPRLHALVESIECALEALGFPRETRPFAGHITLGRVRARSTRGLSRHAGAEGHHKVAHDQGIPSAPRGTPSEPGVWGAMSGSPMSTDAATRVTRIVLMRSQLTSGGASYKELGAFSLAPPR